MNLANKVTLMRICLVPVFLIFLLLSFKYSNIFAALIFVLAASTDSVDGHIARRRNEITNFGKFIDPLADKLLVSAALIGLVGMDRISPLPAIIIISREFIVTGLRMLAASEGVVIAASWWGKAKTITQIIAIMAILLNNMPFALIGIPFDIIALYIAVIVTVISAIDYFWKNKDLLKQTR